jgi:hypothetical protein
MNLYTYPGLSYVVGLTEYSSPVSAPLAINNIATGTYTFELNWYAWTTTFFAPSTLFPYSFIEVEGYTFTDKIFDEIFRTSLDESWDRVREARLARAQY